MLVRNLPPKNAAPSSRRGKLSAVAKHVIGLLAAALLQSPSSESSPLAAVESSQTVRAYEALKRADYDEVLKICGGILKYEPNNIEAIRYRGIALYHTGAVGDALTNLRYCISKGNQLPVDHLYVGDCLFASGQYREAIASYNQAVLLDPRLKAGYEGLARSYQAAGHTRFARKVMQGAKLWGHHLELPEHSQLAGISNYGS